MGSYEPGAGDRYRIDTPERVDLDYDVASLGSRLLAALVDTLLLSVLSILFFVLGTVGLVGVGGILSAFLRTEVDSATLGIAFLAITLFLSFLVFWGYYLFFELIWHGQSPGKRWIGLRVIREGGYPIGFSESAIRNLVRLVDFLPVYYGVGALTMFIDRRSRRLGDIAAGTLVVKERREIRLDSLGLSRSPGAPTEPPDAVDAFPNAGLLTAADQSLLREYLLRRSSLTPDAASNLAAQLASAFAARMDHDLSGEPPESFLNRLARQLGIWR